VVDERPPQNFNPPLTEPNTPILVQVMEIFSEPFSLFTHPLTMLGPSVFSIVVEPTILSSSGTGRNPLGAIPVMSTLPPLSSIRPTPSIPFYFGSTFWATLVMSSYLSISLSNASTPIPSILTPTFGSSSNGGSSFGLSMGSGIPMSGPISYGTSSPFGWNMSIDFGPISRQTGGSSTYGDFNFPWARTHFHREHPLGEIFHHGEVFLLFPHLVLGALLWD
jgi:hypothetical protein